MRPASTSLSSALTNAWMVLLRELRAKAGWAAPGLSYSTLADRLSERKAELWDTFVELHAGCTADEGDVAYAFEHAEDRSADLPFDKPFDSWSERDRRWGNIEAFRVLRRAAESTVGLSDSDRRMLTAWSGWGGIQIEKVPLDPEVFTDDYIAALVEWRGLRKKGNIALPEGYTPKSKLLLGAVNQFFTPMEVCRFMWQLAERAARSSGLHLHDFETILEPSAGSGRFLASAPTEGPLSSLKWTTVELDDIGSGVIKGAYPDHEHYHASFEQVAAASARAIKLFDMIIGNPPYPERMASDRLDDPDLSHYDQAHTYFVRRCADLLKPGGIMVMLTPLGQIYSARKAKPDLIAFRRDMLTFCDFIGGAALPADIFPGAMLNLCVHVWRKKLPRAYRVPPTVAGAPTTTFLEGKYFQTVATSNVLGTWEESTRYKDSYVLTGAFEASMADGVVLDDSPVGNEDLRDVLLIRKAYTDPGVLKITGATESLANRLRRQSREVGEVSIDGLILLRARNLSSRIERYLTSLSTDPSLARVGRTELLLDIQTLLAVIDDPWSHPVTSTDPDCHWLREVVSQDGSIASHLTDGDDGQERPRSGTVFSSADEAIRWYSSRTGRCTSRDLIRHGYSEADGLIAVQTASDLAIIPAVSTTGEMDFQRKPEFLAPKGSTWDLLDQISSLRTDESLEEAARFCYNRQFVWLTEHLRPVPLSEINPEPRAEFITEEILSAFASWWLRDATPGEPSIAWDADKPYVLFPGVRMIKSNEVWTAYPARLMLSVSHRSSPSAVFKKMTVEEAQAAGIPPEEWLPLEGEYERKGSGGKTLDTRRVVQWEPLPPIQDFATFSWAKYWDVLGPSPEELSAYTSRILPAGQQYLHGHNWYKAWRGTNTKAGQAEDRYYVLMGHLNQTNRVAKLGGSQDRLLSKITLVEGASNESVLTDAFVQWLTMNPWASDKVVTAYNRTFRGAGSREYPGEELTIYRRVSAGSQINLLPYQWSTCRRMADTLACIAALDVGFGKTFTGIAGIALARQNGQIRRAVVKVPPSVTTNWYTEASRLLPDYMIVVIGYTLTDDGRTWREDSPEERAAKWRGYARGLGDLLIVPETKWADDVAMSADSIIQVFQNAYVSRRAIARGTAEIEVLEKKVENAQRELADAQGTTRKAEDAQKRLTRLQEKLSQMNSRAARADSGATGKTIYTLAKKLDMIRTTQPFRPTRSYSPWSPAWSVDKLIDTMEKAGIPVPDVPEGATTQAYHELIISYMRSAVPAEKGTITVPHMITWEELDVDCLVIDEAHRDKNIMGPEAREKVEFLGAPPGDTRSALDTWLRCQWILQRYDRGVMLLTATPLKNSPLEIFNLLSLISRTIWTSRGVGDPDGFIARYLRIEDDITITARGVPEPRRVVAGFKRLSELREVVRAVMERKTTEDLIAYWTSIGQIEVYRRNFPSVTHKTLNANLDDIQKRVFEPVRSYLLAGAGVVSQGADGDCIVLSGRQREQARSLVIKAKREAGALTAMESVMDNVEQDDPGRFALMLKDILEKCALDPRLLESMRLSNLAELPKARERISKALEAFKAEDRDPPSKEHLADLLNSSWGDAQEAVGYERDVDTGEIVGAQAHSAAGVGAGGVLAKKAIDPLTRRLLTAIRAENASLNAVVLVDAILYSAAGLDGVEDFSDLGESTFGSGISTFMGVTHRTLPDDLETPEGFHVTKLFTELYAVTRLHPPKMLAVAEKIVEGGKIGPKGTMLFDCASIIFAEYTSIHGWLIDALVAAGIPRHRIAVMDGSVPVQRRQALANEFTGTATSSRIYDVLIANSVAYEGMNLQRETCAVYHLDLPWEPASMHQREGRAVRQGNLWGHVDVYTVLSPGTLDPFKYGVIEGKRAWQEEFYNGSDDEMDNPDKDAAKVSREELVANLVFYENDADSVRARECLLQHVRRIREAKKRAKLLKKLNPTIAALQAAADALANAAKGKDATLTSLARDALHRPASSLRTLGEALGKEHASWIEKLIDAAYQGPVGFAWAPRVSPAKDIKDFTPVIYRAGDVVLATSVHRGHEQWKGDNDGDKRIAINPFGDLHRYIQAATLEEALDQVAQIVDGRVPAYKQEVIQGTLMRLTRVYPFELAESFGDLSTRPLHFSTARPDRVVEDEGGDHDSRTASSAYIPLTADMIGIPLPWDEKVHLAKGIARMSGRGVHLWSGKQYFTPPLSGKKASRQSFSKEVLAANRNTIILTLAGMSSSDQFVPTDGLLGRYDQDLTGYGASVLSRRDVLPMVFHANGTFYLGWPHELVRAVMYPHTTQSTLPYEREYPNPRSVGVLPSWLLHIYNGAPEPDDVAHTRVAVLQSDGTLRPTDPNRKGYSLVLSEDGASTSFAKAFASGNVRILETEWTYQKALRAPALPREPGDDRVKNVIVPEITDRAMTASDLAGFMVAGPSAFHAFRERISGQIGGAPTSVDIARLQKRLMPTSTDNDTEGAGT